MRGIAAKMDQDVLLWRGLEKELGVIVPHDQLGQPGEEGEGDCCAQAMAMGVDVLTAAEIHYLGEAEIWHAKSSVEAIYWGSRFEIGRPRLSEKDWESFCNFDGAVGEWAALWVQQYGILHRQTYHEGNNEIDLSGYSPARSRSRRSTGVPDWLEPIAKKHPVRGLSNVKSGEEVLDAIVSGQPVILCSSYAFPDIRDKDGFSVPYLGPFRKKWYHAMVATGALVKGRIGAVIQNSHGDWNSGPSPYGGPAGSFAVDVKYLDLMTKDWYDCWAISSYVGHAAAKKHRRHLLYVRGF